MCVWIASFSKLKFCQGSSLFILLFVISNNCLTCTQILWVYHPSPQATHHSKIKRKFFFYFPWVIHFTSSTFNSAHISFHLIPHFIVHLPKPSVQAVKWTQAACISAKRLILWATPPPSFYEWTPVGHILPHNLFL